MLLATGMHCSLLGAHSLGATCFPSLAEDSHLDKHPTCILLNTLSPSHCCIALVGVVPSPLTFDDVSFLSGSTTSAVNGENFPR